MMNLQETDHNYQQEVHQDNTLSVEVKFDFDGIDKSTLKWGKDENRKKKGDVVDQEFRKQTS
jgi:hypothetical protein